METTFSRGFCHGWLDGPDHRALVSGEGSAKRGVYLGEVRGVRGERILVELAGPLRRGDGVVFEGDRSQARRTGRPRVRDLPKPPLDRDRSRRGPGRTGLPLRLDRSRRDSARARRSGRPTIRRRLAGFARRTPRAQCNAACRSICGRSVGRKSAARGCDRRHRRHLPLGVAAAVARGDETPVDRRDAPRAIRPARQDALRVAAAGSTISTAGR